MPRYTSVSNVIQELESVLIEAGLWDETPPDANALASTEPFCVDTLNFNQWLQFVFIGRMQLIVEGRLPLPENSNIATMAEHYFQDEVLDTKNIISILMKFDKLIENT